MLWATFDASVGCNARIGSDTSELMHAMDRTSHHRLGLNVADDKDLQRVVKMRSPAEQPRRRAVTCIRSLTICLPAARIALLIIVAAGTACAVEPAPPPDFDREIAPLLARRCLGCHGGAEPKGNLDLTRRDAALRGGESGVVLVAGEPDESLLWQYVRDGDMPPKQSLPESERQLLERWIAGGLPWGAGAIDPLKYTSEARAGYDWWSLQPLTRPAPPAVPEAIPQGWVRNAVDAFVASHLAQAALKPSPEADRRTLIRRLSFDLTGLPPTPGEIDAFARTASPDACEQVVERLLSSEHYGERWARHWLDVARYGESQGFERDKVRSNAWPYRDWVIEALNRDVPYNEFARLQIAGDVLRPDDAEAVTATGFLVAGPYDEVGQQQQSAAMKAVVREDELEDIIGTVGQTFLGLTVNCARCHDHKFDPITQAEYYRLSAALGGVRHGERTISSPEARNQIAELTTRRKAISRRMRALEQRAIAAIDVERQRTLAATPPPAPLARWTFGGDFDDDSGTLRGTAQGPARTRDGQVELDGKSAYVATAPLDREVRAKTLEAWVQLTDLEQRGGGVISVQTIDGNEFDAIVFGEREPGQWMAGSNGFVRTRSFNGPEETEAATSLVHIAMVYEEDGTITAYRNGVLYGAPYKSDGAVAFPAGRTQVLFGLRHGTSAGGNRVLAGTIDEARLYDRALSAAEIAATSSQHKHVPQARLLAAMSTDERVEYQSRREELTRIDARLAELQNKSVYAVTPRQPDVGHVLLRGNPAAPGDVVAPGGIASLAGVNADFGLAPNAPEGDRRARLAAWITGAHNPLFARVIVNRVWHYHFGVGLVDTPNDFGFNGGRPTHRELLDYLASYLMDNGWSLKQLHRLIVASATYRQASLHRSDCAAVDAGNRLLWRKDPIRLDAETLRDAILSVAGELNPQVGGPPYQDFKTFTFNSQFYEMIDPVGHEFHRRTIYRTWLRSGRNPLLDTFDCPDPSTTSPKRAVTTTPVQSLALLNNSFVLRMADAFAERVAREAGTEQDAQVRACLRLAYGREPAGDEAQQLAAFVREFGLPALCRVVFNSNEFLYVD
jgi:hypothetical protein